MLETQEHQVQGHSARNINRTDSGTQQFDFSQSIIQRREKKVNYDKQKRTKNLTPLVKLNFRIKPAQRRISEKGNSRVQLGKTCLFYQEGTLIFWLP